MIVTADHGMGDDGNHAGPTPEETEVPFYTVGFRLDRDAPIKQTEIAGLVCRLMEIDPGQMPAFSGAVDPI